MYEEESNNTMETYRARIANSSRSFDNGSLFTICKKKLLTRSQSKRFNSKTSQYRKSNKMSDILNQSSKNLYAEYVYKSFTMESETMLLYSDRKLSDVSNTSAREKNSRDKESMSSRSNPLKADSIDFQENSVATSSSISVPKSKTKPLESVNDVVKIDGKTKNIDKTLKKLVHLENYTANYDISFNSDAYVFFAPISPQDNESIETIGKANKSKNSLLGNLIRNAFRPIFGSSKVSSNSLGVNSVPDIAHASIL